MPEKRLMFEDLPIELRELLKEDLKIYGNAFLYVDDETKRVRRVDPTKVVMHTE